jgi:adenylate cyclase
MKQPERARASYAAALEVVERLLTDTPDDEFARRPLAMLYAGLGRKSDAIREAKGAVERGRMSRGTTTIATEDVWMLAGVYAKVGEPDLALDRLEFLLSVPSLLSYGRLRFDPQLDPLRDHPRFQKLLDKATRDLPSPPPS